MRYSLQIQHITAALLDRLQQRPLISLHQPAILRRHFRDSIIWQRRQTEPKIFGALRAPKLRGAWFSHRGYLPPLVESASRFHQSCN
ncbi:hypothetical protein HOLleu_21565 [Holothuria leucospilota]|uniref:Uncharacterized protein n=1 Tax=Holothuria leucospilota TaxID=206669 RepID=A0A9Q1BY38_HOLLE|nr:hypothetical protein HOLleu_21565 [Holothuria leucospilota]